MQLIIRQQSPECGLGRHHHSVGRVQPSPILTAEGWKDGTGLSLPSKKHDVLSYHEETRLKEEALTARIAFDLRYCYTQSWWWCLGNHCQLF